MDAQQIATLSADEKRTLLAELLKKKASSSKSLSPLSHNQRAMWFLYQLAPESSAYNIAFVSRIHSPVDISALKRTLQALIDRHSALRTTFFMADGGEPMQKVHPHREVHFEEIDASTWTEESLNEQVIAAHRRPFNLEEDLPLRAYLFTQSASRYVFLITVHHIVFDGWSGWMFVDELRTLYAAEKSGVPASLPSLTHQYVDYVHWQAEMLAGSEGEQLWNYWRQKLAGASHVLNLPTDRARPAFQTYNGATQSFTLDEGLTHKLRTLAKTEKTTLYTVLVAAFQLLLSHYSGQDDILIGSPMSGRNRPEYSGIVGDFINMVILRANLSQNVSFREFLGQVRQTVLEALAHQDYPFSLLVEQLAPNRDPSRSPLFQVSFTLQKPQRFSDITKLTGKDNAKVDFGGLELEPFDLAQQDGQLDLTLEMMETDDHLFANLKYNIDLFDAATIVRMQTHFQMLLEGIVANPHQRLSDIPILTEGERQQLLVEWNDTAMAYPRELTLAQLFEAQADKSPEAVAVVFGSERLTYRQLNERSNQLAHYLQKLGIGAETLVGIYMERSIEMVVGLLGVLKAGGAYLPLDPAFPTERLAFMVADSQTEVVLTQQALLNDMPLEGDIRMVCLDEDWPQIALEPVEAAAQQAQPANLAYVLYTSGSTGKPKGVQIPHRAVVNFLTSMRQEPGLTDQDVLLSVTTLSFDISVLEIFLPLTIGARLVLVSRETAADGVELAAELARSQATVMQATPATWRMLIETGWTGDKRLKILCGGEALPRTLANQLLERSASLWNVYGPTETTIWSTLVQVQPGEGPAPIGRPIGNTQCYVLDRHQQPVPIGVPGELYIGGDGLARGYLNRPELTQEKFIPNPFKPNDEVGMMKDESDHPSLLTHHSSFLYKTGDLVRYLPDGNIEFLNRVDHQVKIRGFRIELGEIEAVLSQHPAIREAVVVVREDRPDDKRLVAYLISKQKDVPTASDLRSFVREQLPDYMTPAAFVFLDAYPLTPNKKMDIKALPAPDQTRPELQANFVAPRTKTEEQLALILAELLSVEQIGIHDNFFELGGHSLLATQLISRVNKAFEVEISLRRFFEAPTVADLALIITQIKAADVDDNELLQILAELDDLSLDDIQTVLKADS